MFIFMLQIRVGTFVTVSDTVESSSTKVDKRTDDSMVHKVRYTLYDRLVIAV